MRKGPDYFTSEQSSTRPAGPSSISLSFWGLGQGMLPPPALSHGPDTAQEGGRSGGYRIPSTPSFPTTRPWVEI